MRRSVFISMAVLIGCSTSTSTERRPEPVRVVTVEDLIDQLGSDDIREREAATQDLVGRGEAARPQLELATKEADPEIRARARNVLNELDLSHVQIKTGPACGRLVSEHTFGDYTVRTYYPDDGPGSFEILLHDKPIYSELGYSFDVEIIGKDITGDGLPNLVIHEWTGGVHGAYIWRVFQLGDHARPFRKIAQIKSANGGSRGFIDLDGDSIPEFALRDWTFQYWPMSFAGSPYTEVILRWKDGDYRFARDLMSKSAPTDEEIVEWAKEFRAQWQENDPPTDLWCKMLDLIYSGNAHCAWKLYGLAWPDQIPGRDVTLHDFRNRLQQSPYWPDIEAMNAERK